MFTRWLVYHVASGQSFFSGVACLLAAVCLSAWKARPARMARNILAGLGGTLVFASATPLPTWSYLVLLVATSLWLLGEASCARIPRRLVRGLRVAVSAMWLAAALVELPYHLPPSVPRLGRPTLGIVGDSLTAWLDGSGEMTWPAILADRRGISARNHAAIGADVASALRQAAQISPDERLVLLEIGGNDILGGTSPEGFEAGLARLLSAVVRPGRTVVMLELPLPPTYNAIGRIQRRLARQYGAILVPKAVLFGVLQREGATRDSIHLTREGHESMAEAIWGILRAAYEGDGGPG